MNPYRLTAIALTACTAGLSLAACTAGITTAPSGSPHSPAMSHTASSPTVAASHSASPSASAGPADAINVDAPIGTFPVPHEAQVVANMSCGNQLIIELSAVTPSQASRFYVPALPRAGYKVTGNTLLTNTGNGNGLPGAAAEIDFTGHGYKGMITAISGLGPPASMGASPSGLPSDIVKNFIGITLTPPGAAGCPTPTGP